MKKVFGLLAIVALVFAMNAQAASNNDVWQNYTGMKLNVEHVNIHAAANFSGMKKNGNATLGGPGNGPGTSNFCADAYTAPTWATTSPSVFSIEQYSFTGGSGATVDHRTVTINNAGPWPTSLALAYVWADCGAGVVFPPVPALLGTNIDGNTILLSLPYTGIWYVTVGISGFSAGTYDWGWMANYAGTTPIPVPASIQPSGPSDLGGFEFGPGANNALHNVTDAIGNGKGSGRPWCFKVQ
jgi:hypothetical protein